MKINRYNIFETNSSSVHSLVMCSDKEYEDWKNGNYLIDISTNNLVPVDEARYKDPDRYMTKSQYDKYVESVLSDCSGDYFERDYKGIKAFGFFYMDY
jgi:hypothetical protein